MTQYQIKCKAQKQEKGILLFIAVSLGIIWFILFIGALAGGMEQLLAWTLFLALLSATSFVVIYGWKKIARGDDSIARRNNEYAIPFTLKVPQWSYWVTIEADGITSIFKGTYENRKLLYTDIAEINVEWQGACILRLKRISKKLSLRINLSAFSKEDWCCLVRTISEHAPQAVLDDIAESIKSGDFDL